MEENLAKQIIIEAINMAMKNGSYGIVETMNIVKAIEALRLNIKSDNEQHNLELN